ncbi:MAG: hypothetical protein QM817_03635 [Archangium sp.]
MAGGVNGASRTTEAQVPETMEGVQYAAPKRPAKNLTETHDAVHGQQTAPADAPREATKTVAQEVDEQMAADPEAMRLQRLLDQSESLANDWNYLQDHLIGSGDGILDRQAIIDVTNDLCQSPEMKAAAQRLLANREFLNGVNGTDTKASSQEVDAFISGLRNQIASIRAAKTDEVKAARGMQTNAQAGTGTAGATPNGAPAAPPASGSGAADAVPLPPQSDKPGVEGAMENLGNMGDYYSKQMVALANDSSIDPAKKQALMADLQTKQQATMNMLNQLIQMMQNTAKLWSDIAMNSVRNIK